MNSKQELGAKCSSVLKAMVKLGTNAMSVSILMVVAGRRDARVIGSTAKPLAEWRLVATVLKAGRFRKRTSSARALRFQGG